MRLNSVAGIARKEDTFLVKKRKPGGSMGETWEFPGGKAEGTESLEEAMHREWLEELEVEIDLGEKLGEVTFSNRGIDYLLHAFIVIPKNENWVFHEHTKATWLTAEELKKLPMSDSDRDLIPYLEKLLPV